MHDTSPGIYWECLKIWHLGSWGKTLLPYCPQVMLLLCFTGDCSVHFKINWLAHDAHYGLSFLCEFEWEKSSDFKTVVSILLIFSMKWRIRRIRQVIIFQFTCMIYLFMEDRIEKWRPKCVPRKNVKEYLQQICNSSSWLAHAFDKVG